MRAAKILADDPNPMAAEHLRQTLRAAATPVPVIQAVSDTVRLQNLRTSQAKFQEAKRKYDLSREARLMQEPTPGRIKVKIVRPRSQMIGEAKRSTEAYVDFIVEVPAGVPGRVVKEAVTAKQQALGLPSMPAGFMRLFLHELGGRQSSPKIGRELLDARAVGEYGIEEGLSYDVTAWQNQTKLGAQVVASLLLVDSRPGKILPEQSVYVDECRDKEVPCYTSLS